MQSDLWFMLAETGQKLLQTREVADKLPALRFGQFGPVRHISPDNSVAEDPKEHSRSSCLHLWDAEAWPLLSSLGSAAVALGAMACKKLFAGCDGSRITLQRILPGASALRRFLQLGIRLIRLSRCSDGIACVLPKHTREAGSKQRQQRRKRQNADHAARLHRRPPKSLLTALPNPANSRETPQRRSKRWLLSFRPNPGESRSVHPEGIFHAMTGAR